MKFAFIQKLAKAHDMALLCRALDVSRSGYYAWLKREPSARKRRDDQLRIRLRALHRLSRKLYGAPRLHAQLRAEVGPVGRCHVARLMREDCLVGRSPRHGKVRTTFAAPAIAANVLARNFTVTAPNLVWVADTTYIHTKDGWAYLVAILDLFSRRIVAWAVGPALDTKLALRAFKRAVALRRPGPGLVFHTDRGGEFTSKLMDEALKAIGAIPSLSASGDCWDNAPMESFFGTLKDELDMDRQPPYESMNEVIHILTDYIEHYYNRRRLHSAIKYQNPVGFEGNVSSLT